MNRAKRHAPALQSLLTLATVWALAAPWAAPLQAGLLSKPESFWECILDELDGVQNDVVAAAAVNQCRTAFPNPDPPRQDASFWGPHTAGECMLKYGKDVASENAMMMIQAACYRLYPIK